LAVVFILLHYHSYNMNFNGSVKGKKFYDKNISQGCICITKNITLCGYTNED